MGQSDSFIMTEKSEKTESYGFIVRSPVFLAAL